MMYGCLGFFSWIQVELPDSLIDRSILVGVKPESQDVNLIAQHHHLLFLLIFK